MSGRWSSQFLSAYFRRLELDAKSRPAYGGDEQVTQMAFLACTAMYGAEQALQTHGALAAFAEELCKSPIERALLLGIVAAAGMSHDCDAVLLRDQDIAGPSRDPKAAWLRYGRAGAAESTLSIAHDDGYSKDEKRFDDYTFDRFLWIRTQHQILQYRADFVVHFTAGVAAPRVAEARDASGCVIECDGHEFHERTKEQAAHDKRRDRELQIAGHSVLRFTGSEIYADPIACGAQVVRFVTGRKERG
jgi:very-short-patch-repair endonuclease